MPLNTENNQAYTPFLIASDISYFESLIGWIKFKWGLFTLWLFNGVRNAYFKVLQLIALTKLIKHPSKPEVVQSFERKKLLDSVSLTIHAGELIAVMGSSGAGKSTLLKILSGQLSPFPGGNVVIKNIDPRIAERPGRVVGYLHQDDILHSELSIQDALYYSARLRHPETSSSDLKKYVKSV